MSALPNCGCWLCFVHRDKGYQTGGKGVRLEVARVSWRGLNPTQGQSAFIWSRIDGALFREVPVEPGWKGMRYEPTGPGASIRSSAFFATREAAVADLRAWAERHGEAHLLPELAAIDAAADAKEAAS